MKEQNKLLLVIFICSLFALFPLFHGFYYTHDGEAHVVRFAAYFRAFSDGQLIPRWAGGDINFRFGSPLFIFFYPLPGYVASILHLFGFSFEWSFLLIVAMSFLLAPFAFFLFASQLVKKQAAVVASLIYAFAPYHFLNLYIRGDIGELMSFVFAPLLFYFIERLRGKQNLAILLLGGIIYALLILSHNISAIIISVLAFAYCAVAFTDLPSRIRVFFMLLIGLALSCYFWLPALVEAKYLNQQILQGFSYGEHFPRLEQLVYSPWGFGTDVNKPGGLSPHIGFLQLIFPLLAIILLSKFRSRRMLLFWLVVFCLGVFFATSGSTFVWEHVLLLQRFQFPWRFVALCVFASAVLAGYVIDKVNNLKIVLVCIFIVFLSIVLYARVKTYESHPDSFYINYSGSSFHHGEASTQWTAGDPYAFPKNRLQIIGGEGEIKNSMFRSQMHTFLVDAKTSVQILDNTIYFPGWQVNANKQKIPIEFQDINHRGLLTFVLPRGVNKVEVVFHDSPIRLIASVISLITFCAILGVGFMRVFRQRPL